MQSAEPLSVWHVTKNLNGLHGIIDSMRIMPGRNVESHEQLAHVSSKRFVPGNNALDTIAPNATEVWVFELLIEGTFELIPDPADNAGEDYGGGWLVSPLQIPIQRIMRIEYIENARAWERRELQSVRWPIRKAPWVPNWYWQYN